MKGDLMNIPKIHKYAKVTLLVSLSFMAASAAVVVSQEGKVL